MKFPACAWLLLACALLLGIAGCATAGSAALAPAPAMQQQEVNFACTQDSDCAIKDVGNCCGAYPACVHRDSPTFPERVQAECVREGRSSICGFPSLSGCRCEAGRCAGVPGPGTPTEKEQI